MSGWSEETEVAREMGELLGDWKRLELAAWVPQPQRQRRSAMPDAKSSRRTKVQELASSVQ